MGLFGGHILPGSYFIVFAVWWTVQLYRRIYQSSRQGAPPFRSATSFRCDFLCGRMRNWEWEGFFKICFSLGVFVGELLLYTSNQVHATAFFFFGICGLAEIMVHHKVSLPSGIEYVVTILAIIVEAILFQFHLQGRSPLDVHIHMLLVSTLYATAVVLIFEMRNRQSTILTWIRTYLFFLQGTWFCQLAYIMGNPNPDAAKWEGDNMEHIMIATMMFAWHMGAVLATMLSLGFVVQLVMRCCAEGDVTAYDVMKTGSGSGKTGNGTEEYCVDYDNNADYPKCSKTVPQV